MRFITALAAIFLQSLGLILLSGQSAMAMTSMAVLDPQTPINQYVLDSWGVDDGLPEEGILALEQTRDGYLWAGTGVGLLRFDGQEFRIFNDLDDDAFVDNTVQFLFEDSLGQLWIETRGNNLLIYRNGDFEPMQTPPNFIAIESILELDDGRIWISSYRAIWEARIDDPFTLREVTAQQSAWVKIQASENLPAKLLDDSTTTELIQVLGPTQQALIQVREDDAGQLWVSLQDPGRPRSLTALRLSLQNDAIEWSSRQAGIEKLRVVFQDAAATIWLGAWDEGIYRYANHDLQARSTSGGLDDPDVYAIESDREGHLWLGLAYAGLSRLKNSSVKTISVPEGLPGPMVRAIIEEEDGSIWLALRYSGLAVLEGDEIRHISTADGLIDDQVYSLFKDSDGAIWAGTTTGVSRITNEGITSWGKHNGFPYSEARSINSDGKGTLWIGTLEGLVVFKQGKIQLIDELYGIELDQIIHLFYDRQQRLWVGTVENGVFIINGDAIQHISGERIGSHVRGLHQTASNDVWLATLGSGISRYREGELKTIRRRNGLFDDNVNTIIDDSQGHLWLTSENGISRVSIEDTELFFDGNLKTLPSRNFNASDGMRDIATVGSSGPGILQLSNGELWFATDDGVAVIRPSELDSGSAPPQVIVQSLLADNQLVPHGVMVPAGTHSVEIKYTATSLIDGKRNRFRYQLLGLDEQPVEAGTRRVAFYNDLKPGDYAFHVSAANAHGVWNTSGVNYPFTVEAFFYQTRIFYAGLALLLFFLVIWADRMRIRQMKRTQQLLETEVKNRTREILHQRDQIAEQADRLRMLDEAKSRFFANVTHEIRTPLTTMMGPLEDWLEENEGTHDQSVSRPVRRALESSKRLYWLVNQLMSFARIESGETRLRTRRDDLVHWLEGAWTRFVPLARSRRLEFVLSGPVEHIFVEFDADQMDFVISNLISNAIKFTEPGGTISLEIAALKKAGRNEVEISVSDSGCGIDEKHLELVFERFFQSSETHVKGQAGTGIGLSLVREIAELHGGRVTLESVLGQGSTFVVALPLHELEKDTVSIELQHHDFRNEVRQGADDSDESTLGGEHHSEDIFTILVVDDDDDVRQYIVDGLSGNYRILQAVSGNSGFNIARQQQPDLIVCDVMMPDGTGLDLLKQLRSETEIAATPVILLTAKAEADDTLEGLAAGANDYITKPFSMSELKARINSQIESQLRLFNELRLSRLKDLSISVSEARGTRETEFLRKLEAYILTQLSEQTLSGDEIALELHMSRAALFRKVRKLANQTPGEIIRRIRLEAARRLLEEDRGSISEIAYAVGFRSRPYFSRCFKEHFKQSPSEFISKGSSDPASD